MRVGPLTVVAIIALGFVPLLVGTAPVSIVRSNYGLGPLAAGTEAPEWEIMPISRRADNSNDQTGKVCHPIMNYRSCVGPKIGLPFHDICDTYTRNCPAKKPKGGKTNDGKKGHGDPPASASLLSVDGTDDDDTTTTGNTTSRALPVANKQIRITSIGASHGPVHFLSKRLKGIIHKGDDSDAARASVKDNGSLNVVEAQVLYDGGRVKPGSHSGGHGHDGAVAAEQPTVVKAHEEEEGEQPRGQAQGADKVEA